VTLQQDVAPAPHRFTVHDYQRMGEAGILGEGDRVELIDGQVLEMPPIGPPHSNCVTQLNWLLSRRLSDEFRLAVQNPIRLGEHWEPQPDLAVLRARDYAAEHPGPADVLLVVEVAQTSRGYDRDVKLPRYARAGIPEAWLVDLPGRVVEQYTEPAPDGYRSRRRLGPAETLHAAVLPGLDVPLASVLR
jgi:Uma2 family endonuclease